MRRILFCLVAVWLPCWLASSAAQAADAVGSRPAAQQTSSIDRTPVPATTEGRRQWLRAQLVARLDDPTKIRHMETRLSTMSAKQVDALVNKYEHRIRQQRLGRAQVELAQARLLRDQLHQSRHHFLHGPHGHGNVGFAPVITVLPEGTSLWAGAVVSPDRRYVRINAIPFFSSIPEVHTFNFVTGKTTRLPRTGPPPFGVPQRPAARPQVWHDGLRTRIGSRP